MCLVILICLDFFCLTRSSIYRRVLAISIRSRYIGARRIYCSWDILVRGTSAKSHFRIISVNLDNLDFDPDYSANPSDPN